MYFIVTVHKFTHQIINLVIDFVIKCYCKRLEMRQHPHQNIAFPRQQRNARGHRTLFPSFKFVLSLSPPTEGRANFQTSGIAHSRGRRCPNSGTGLRKKSSWVNLEK